VREQVEPAVIVLAAVTRGPDHQRHGYPDRSNGIIVIEADTPEGHDVDGLASIKQLEAKYGALPETLMGESPSGSLHRYYNHPGNSIKVRCTTSELAPGVDVKGDGGMVIAPPSLRPGKGSYRWLNEGTPIADAPDWLIKLVADSANEPANEGVKAEAPLWKVRAALEALPNGADVGRERWIRVGMAAHAATGGSPEGFVLFDGWSQKWPGYNARDTRRAWDSFKPKEIGAGTLFKLADEAAPGWQDRYYPGDNGPIPLGFTKDERFAFRDRVRNLIVTPSSGQLLAVQSLLGLMPFKFWAERYPSTKGFNSLRAGEALIEACRSAGPFNPQQVRGRGIWREGDRIIINLGGPIPATVRHQYVCFDPIRLDPTSEFEVQRPLRFLQLFSWRHQQDAVLLLGWMALAPICGVLSWRPHEFIFGPTQTGKTTLHLFIKNLLYPLVISTEGGSTKAGIRQTLGPDSQPILIDEFESDQDTVRRIMRLIRSASSADSPVLRGTPEGRAMQFSLRTTFLLCAVNTTGMSPADQSRIVMLELIKHDRDEKIAHQIATEEAHFRELGPRWCAYMVSLAGLVQPALDTFQSAMPIADRHYRQNFATLLAAAFTARVRVTRVSSLEAQCTRPRDPLSCRDRGRLRRGRPRLTPGSSRAQACASGAAHAACRRVELVYCRHRPLCGTGYSPLSPPATRIFPRGPRGEVSAGT
jgi:Bifunctional DNA primase/polymerase, N-terminal/Primase C terminal 2 (PriCT-2)